MAVLAVGAGCGVLVAGGTGPAGAPLQAQVSQADALCRTLVGITDPSHDGRSWITPPPTPWRGTPASGDLRRFEVGSGRDGVCARWTIAAPPPDGSQLVLGMWSPPVRSPSGAITSSSYGYAATLTRSGAVLTYGRDRLGSDAPRVLRGRILRNGRIVTIYVPRSELDRPPANMRGRPPFSFRRFTYEARVITPVGRDGAQGADFAPQERGQEAHYPPE